MNDLEEELKMFINCLEPESIAGPFVIKERNSICCELDNKTMVERTYLMSDRKENVSTGSGNDQKLKRNDVDILVVLLREKYQVETEQKNDIYHIIVTRL